MYQELNFQIAKKSHLEWISKLEKFVSNGRASKVEVVKDFRFSDLGVWYKNYGEETFGYHSEVRLLVIKYKKLFQISENIWQSKTDGNTNTAKLYLKEFKENTNTIITYYKEIEEYLSFEKNINKIINF